MLLQMHSEHFPPHEIDLSNAWVVVESDLKAPERFKRWPAMFSSKYLPSNYKNKRQASKTLVTESSEWHFDVIFGQFQMFGEEGTGKELLQVLERVKTAKATITVGDNCLVQTKTYVRGAKSAGEKSVEKYAEKLIAFQTAKRLVTDDATEHTLGHIQDLNTQAHIDAYDVTTLGFKATANVLVLEIPLDSQITSFQVLGTGTGLTAVACGWSLLQSGY